MTAIYFRAMAVLRADRLRTLPRFQPDPPWRTWVEPCACPAGAHQLMPILDRASHLATVYRHGWRYGKGRTS